MSGDSNLSELKQWANDAESAKANMRRLLPMVAGEEEEAQWATEALENCGAALLSDLNWIASQTSHSHPDVAYWACTLLGRAGQSAQCHRDALERVKNSAGTPAPVKQRAHWALEQIEAVSSATSKS